MRTVVTTMTVLVVPVVVVLLCCVVSHAVFVEIAEKQLEDTGVRLAVTKKLNWWNRNNAQITFAEITKNTVTPTPLHLDTYKEVQHNTGKNKPVTAKAMNELFRGTQNNPVAIQNWHERCFFIGVAGIPKTLNKKETYSAGQALLSRPAGNHGRLFKRSTDTQTPYE